MSDSQRLSLVRAGGASLGARLAPRLVRLAGGELRVTLPGGEVVTIAGRRDGPQGAIVLNNWRALARLALAGDIGFAEGYVAGDWTSPDLLALLRLAARNLRSLARANEGSRLMRALERLRHFGRVNTRRGSRRNIVAHYDLGNAFYALWLDPAMQYSAGLYSQAADTLELAQAAKLARVAALLRLEGGEAVLEIGCGWGGLAEQLVRAAGCSVTGVTLSSEQLAYARERLPEADLRLQDYRDTAGQFDRIVSIEMMEAVGESYWPSYFATLRNRLKPGGLAVIQAITIDEAQFEGYRRCTDFIQQYIFPGGMLPTIAEIRRQADLAGLKLRSIETFGTSYAWTLAEWSKRFHAAWPEIERMGFDTRFRLMWDYYLAYCEGGFRAGTIDVGLYAMERTA